MSSPPSFRTAAVDPGVALFALVLALDNTVVVPDGATSYARMKTNLEGLRKPGCGLTARGPKIGPSCKRILGS